MGKIRERLRDEKMLFLKASKTKKVFMILDSNQRQIFDVAGN